MTETFIGGKNGFDAGTRSGSAQSVAKDTIKGQSKMEKIDHVAVVVTDIDNAVNWYRQNFDCQIDYQDNSWALLNFENVNIALVLPDQHPAHIAVCRQELSQYGPLMEHRDGTQSVYIDDPWGNVFELVKV